MILYVSNNLGSVMTGEALAARNELLALLATQRPVAVFARKRLSLPSAADSVPIQEPRWITSEHIRMTYPPEFRLPYLKAQWRKCRMTQAIRKLRPELLIVQGIQAHRAIEAYRSWDAIPRVLTIHNSPDYFRGIFHDGVNGLARVCREITRYSAVVQASSILCDMWASQDGLDRVPMRVIPNMIDEDMARHVGARGKAEIRSELGIPQDAFAVVCSGSIQYRKGQDLLIAAIERLASQIPCVCLYLVGPVALGWAGRDIVRQVHESPIRSRISVITEVGHHVSFRYICAADLLVLPSREEAMPLSILEAMSMETAVVASDVAGIPDQIVSGKSGLLFSHDHPEGLAEAILRMAKEPEFRLNCARAAKDRFQTHFNRDLYFERWHLLVDDLLGKRGPGIARATDSR